MAKISNISLWALKGNKALRQKVAEVSGVSERTVYRWMEDKDVKLTTAAVMAILREATGLDDDQILDAIPTSGEYKVTA